MLGINKAPIINDLESVLFRVTATQNPQPLGRGECIGVIFQNSFFDADQTTANNASVYVGNSTDQLWLLIPGQESPVFYAEDLKDLYVKLLFPFPNPNGVILTVAVFAGGTDYTTGDVLTLPSPGGTDATVEVATARGAATVVALSAPGALYTAGDVVTLDGTDTQVTIDTVDGGGAVLTFHVSTPGTTATLGVKTVTGGTGAGAQFNVTTIVGTVLTVTLLTGGTLFVADDIYNATGGTGTGARILALTVDDAAPSTCNLICLMYRRRKGGKQ